MSAPTTFAPLEFARETLANWQFSSTDRTKTLRTHGTASNKREAATTWLDYITEGYNPQDADALLRKDGPSLGFTANEIATGARVARECLKLGYSHTSTKKQTRVKVPASALPEITAILGLRPNMISSGFFSRPFQHGHVSRGVWAMPNSDGSQITVGLLPGDPRTDKVEALAA